MGQVLLLFKKREDFLIVVESEADSVTGTHVVGRTRRIVTCFQFVNQVGNAFNGANVECVDVEETENLASRIKRQYGLHNNL